MNRSRKRSIAIDHQVVGAARLMAPTGRDQFQYIAAFFLAAKRVHLCGRQSAAVGTSSVSVCGQLMPIEYIKHKRTEAAVH